MAGNQNVLEILRKKDESSNLGLAIHNAVQKNNPDQQAEIQRLARTQNIPRELIERNLEDAKKNDLRNKINPGEIREKNPGLAKFLSNADNAAVAIDDIDNLRSLEDSINYDPGKPWYQTDLTETMKGMATTLPERMKNVGRSFMMASLDQTDMLAAVYGDDTLQYHLHLNEKQALDESKERAISSLMSDIRASEKIIADMTPDDLSILEQGIRSGVESTITQLPGMLLSLATKNPAYTLAPMVGMTGIESYGRARTEGKAPGEAVVYGGVDAAIEYVTEKIPAESLVNMFKSIGKSGTAKELVKFGISDIGGEQAATLLQSANAYIHDLDAELNKAGSIKEMVDIQLQRQAVTLFASAIGAGSQATIAAGVGSVSSMIGKKTSRELDTLFASADEQRRIDNVIALAQLNVLNGRSQEKFKEYADIIGEGKSMYIDTAVLQQVRENGIVFPDSLNKAYELAVTNGGETVLPLNAFVTDVATKEELVKPMRPHIRMGVNNMTQTELENPDNQSLKQLLERAEKNQAVKTETDEIYELIKDQIIDTGRQSEATAKYSAAIIPAYVAVKAIEFNKSPKEIFERMMLKIAGPDFNIDDAINIGQKNKSQNIDTPEFKNWFSNSKAVDENGKPSKVYHGTDTEFTEFRPSKTGSFGSGIYFSDEKSNAAAAYGDKVMETYLNLQNPWIINADFESKASYSEDVDNPAVEAVLSLKNGRKLVDGMKSKDAEHFDAELTKELISEGYDGIIATYPDGSKEYVAFYPEQIKSATGNRGTYDPNDPNILNQDAATELTIDDIDDEDLDGKTITLQRVEAETGQAVTLQLDAKQAVTEQRERNRYAAELLKCLAS